jgi:sugar lactone lactonase YvrE
MRGRIVGALLAATAIVALPAIPASAKQILPYHYASTFDGTGSTGGKFSTGETGAHAIAIDDSTGNVYVTDATETACPGPGKIISQFDASGQAVPFSALEGRSSLCTFHQAGGVQSILIFDNSGHNGGLFWSGAGEVFNYAPSGLANPNYPILPAVSASSEEAPFYFLNDMAAAPDGNIWYSVSGLRKRDPLTGKNLGGKVDYWFDAFEGGRPTRLTIDTEGNMYLAAPSFGSFVGAQKFAPESQLTYDSTGLKATSPLLVELGAKQVIDMAVDRSNNHVFLLERAGGFGNPYGEVTEFTPDGAKVQTFGLPEAPYGGLKEVQGIAVNSNTHDVYVSKGMSESGVDILKQGVAATVPDTTTLAPEPAATSAVLKGLVNPAGIDTTECRFEWGLTPAYTGGTRPCSEGDVFTGAADVAVSASLTGLTNGKTFHYRLAAKNANGYYSYGVDRVFEAAGTPSFTPPVLVKDVNTDSARLEVKVNPVGGTTRYWVEYGPEDCATPTCAKFPAAGEPLPSRTGAQTAALTLPGLTPGTPYHFRVVAQNGTGTASTPDQTLTTFPTNPTEDHCDNGQVRQQTRASLLMDCRAYELASARNAGGYDVESNVVPGQQPLPVYPDAQDSVLYALHFGLVPGVAGNPTNYERDPYVATRGADGWTTRYVGIPATAGGGLSDPFGSPLEDAGRDLSGFAFGGSGICAPCFEDGTSGTPVRLSDGSLVQGMAGALDPGPGAQQAGFVRDPLSADGEHLVFGSTSQFELDGNNNGDVTLYERDLDNEVTKVISKTTGGTTMSGTDIGEIAISEDGSRVLFARKVGLPDPAGNVPLHLYMHLADSAPSADVSEGSTTGVLFAGMTGDGEKIFFTTKDALLGADTDASVDLYEATVSGPANVDLELVSTGTGGSGNTDACNPPGEPRSWNAAAGNEGRCNVVAFAGGAGVATGDGTAYFVSPEKLDGGSNGEEQDQANLYVVRPGGSPDFVATIDSSTGKGGPPRPKHPLANSGFITGLSSPESIAVDQTNGDVYVSEAGAGSVSRFTSAGAPKEFSALGSNKLTGQNISQGESQIAVDSAPTSPFKGALYVTTNGSKVRVYASNGEKLGELAGFGEACGVSVDQSNGTVYVGSYPSSVYKFVPIASGAPGTVTKANYQPETQITLSGGEICNVEADSSGHVYAKAYYSGGSIKRYDASEFAVSPPTVPGTAVGFGNTMQSDPNNSDLYVDAGSQITQYDSSGSVIQSFGSAQISGSRGVGVDVLNERVYATNGNSIVEFGAEPQPYEPVSDAAIEHGVRQAAVHDSADFQVTSDGEFAAFSSASSLTGYLNAGFSEIYRYRATPGSESLDCVSCAPTNAAGTVDTSLTSGATNLIPDGRIFFESPEGLVLRDTNHLQDVYEWADGSIELISTGSGVTDVGLLGASSDGADVFFFTRQTLVPEDENGNAMKIYDARADGGFLFIPARLPCAASDECHGPGTVAPARPPINTVTGTGEPSAPVACRRGFVKRGGRCVKRRHRGHRHHRGPGAGSRPMNSTAGGR